MHETFFFCGEYIRRKGGTKMEASPFPPHVCAHTIRRRLFPPFHPPFFTFLHPAANNLSPFRETNVAQNWEEMRTEEEEEEEEEEEATVLCIRTRSGIASFWSGKDWEIGCGRGGLFVPMCGPRMEIFFLSVQEGPNCIVQQWLLRIWCFECIGHADQMGLDGTFKCINMLCDHQ